MNPTEEELDLARYFFEVDSPGLALESVNFGQERPGRGRRRRGLSTTDLMFQL